MYLILKKLGLVLFCHFPKGKEHVVTATGEDIGIFPWVQEFEASMSNIVRSLSQNKTLLCILGNQGLHIHSPRGKHTQKDLTRAGM
jgi:hypothetical protein